MNKLRELTTKNLSGKKVLLLFIVTNIVYLMMLTITIPKTMAYSGEMKLLDMMPMGYNFEYVNHLFESLGEKGRSIYLYHQIPLDMLYPFLFGMSYSLIMAYFLIKIDKLRSYWFYLCLLPIMAGAADYLENFGVIFMLNNFPNLSESSVNLTSAFTIIKSLLTTLYFISLVVVLMMLGIKKLNKKKTLVNTF